VRGLSVREDEETVRGADEDVVPETCEAPAEDTTRGDVDEETEVIVIVVVVVFVFVLLVFMPRLAEHDPVSRAERELICPIAEFWRLGDGSTPAGADGPHVDVGVDVAGGHDAVPDATKENRWK
jgi:hypothetical protein